MLQTMLTAIQPSNRITLGNYIGAIKNFLDLQEKYRCWMFVADLHAITVKQDPTQLRLNTLKAIATYKACGVDPRTTIFVQSHVPEHTEFGWILNCHSYLGELQRMHQFKEKSIKQGESINTGLFTYPVLMAADILLYRAEYVPVGDDQKQHIELCRDIAQRINHLYGENTLVIPKAINVVAGSRIMSLQDPTSKMSKSDPNENATVFMDDSDDVIMRKFKRAVTDSGTEVTDEDSKPGIRNLLEIQAALSGKSRLEVAQQYVGKQYGYLKKETGELAIATIAPIREKTNMIMDNLDVVFPVLKSNAGWASAVSKITLDLVKERMGFLINK